MAGPISAPADLRQSLVAAARTVAKAAAGRAYLKGGKSTAGFDCSGFVYYVLHDVFPDYAYLSTDAIAASDQFRRVMTCAAGDLIFFPAGQVPYEVKKKNTRSYENHVGIVLDAANWIGSQSSTGVAPVPFTNPWWGSRTRRYYRYRGLPD